MAVAALLAIGVAVGALTIHDLRSHGGSVPGGIFLALVLAALAVGMYRRRYWAVLGFEALLAFQILVTSLALVSPPRSSPPPCACSASGSAAGCSGSWCA